jgi:hypothetical protein
MEEDLQQRARAAGLRGFLGSSSEGILDRLYSWAQNLTHNRLPLHINKIVIYPDEMPMSTLQFTERLGYRQENAIRMLTSGCAHTLWAVLLYLGKSSHLQDQRDQEALSLAQKWTGVEQMPSDEPGWQQAQKDWSCQRTACTFHPSACPRGARKP